MFVNDHSSYNIIILMDYSIWIDKCLIWNQNKLSNMFYEYLHLISSPRIWNDLPFSICKAFRMGIPTDFN